MTTPKDHRRRVRHYHDPGDLHELTFSCHDRLPLLTNDRWRDLLAESIDRAVERYAFSLTAFVFMPEHVHLLVYSRRSPDIDSLLYAIKRPFSYRIKVNLQAVESPLLERLTVRHGNGEPGFRFWLKGPGYARNLKTRQAVLGSIDYKHNNPVVRGLCQRAEQWRWSSARWYLSDGQCQDPALPMVHGLPGEFLDDLEQQ